MVRKIPNRIIKESLRESKAVSSLTDFQFRLWLYLITYVDDYGRGKADPELLASVLFPRIKSITERHVRDGMAALVSKGLIITYIVDGDPYFYFPNWAKHQRIQTKKSKFPAPPEDIEIHGESRLDTETDGESPPESNPIQSNTNKNPNTNPKKKPIQEADAFEEFTKSQIFVESDVLLKTLRNFENMRKQIKKPMSDNAKELLIKNLKKYPPAEWVEILEQSIMNSWQGIFPLEKQKEVLPF